ncbi:hypothetical protein BX616_006153, partial [Lobosporangium transversale]
FAIHLKKENKFSFTWSTDIDKATVPEFRKAIEVHFSQYLHGDYLEIHVYTRPNRSEMILDDAHLRSVLKIVQVHYRSKLVTDLGNPSKSFSSWTFADVCAEYNITSVCDPQLTMIPSYTGIEAMVLESDSEKKIRYLSGRRGHGPVDFSVHSRTTTDFDDYAALGVTN